MYGKKRINKETKKPVNNDVDKVRIPRKQKYINNKQKVLAMSRRKSNGKGADNKANYSGKAKWTSTKKKKRPSKERGPYGDNTGTVQNRDYNPHDD